MAADAPTQSNTIAMTCVRLGTARSSREATLRFNRGASTANSLGTAPKERKFKPDRDICARTIAIDNRASAVVSLPRRAVLSLARACSARVS
jgi:hypothetical protein